MEMEGDTRLTREIKSFIINEGADLVGVAPVKRFEKAPKETQPTHYMPNATSVISIALHIPNGVCDVWGEYTEPGKTAGPYLFYGYGFQNLELARIANLVAKKLEYRGYKSIIFPPTWAVSWYRFFERLPTEGILFADFSHRHAAVAAGLGEIGWHGLCITPEFGTRVRFNSIITDAPLASDPVYEGPSLCKPELCKLKCVRICPTKAISTPPKGLKCTIGGRVFEYSKTDHVRCMYGILALVKGSGGRGHVDIPPGPGNLGHLLEAREQQNPLDRHFMEFAYGFITGDFCGRCLHQCPAPKFKEA